MKPQDKRRVTQAEARVLLDEAKHPKCSKFKVRTDPAGHVARTMDWDGKPTLFASISEMKLGAELKLRQRKGEINNLERQMNLSLYPCQKVCVNGVRTTILGLHTKVDFRYWEHGALIWHEFKGAWTEAYRVKYLLIVNAIMWGNAHPSAYRITHADGTREEWTAANSPETAITKIRAANPHDIPADAELITKPMNE
jgi:hypothetical protein